MRTSRCASIGVVSELVDMHATLGIGIIASDVVGDCGVLMFGSLLKGDGTLDFRVSSDDSDYREKPLA